MAAAGKLAAALHRRTHRVTPALAYAVLEWVLIALLLINGLLAYAIARFAAYFGLTPPCLLCSRVDRLIQADGGEAGGARWLRDVFCGAHAAEISALGYCLHHRRLAESRQMCEGCLSMWKEMKNEAGEKSDMACSCCEAVVRTSLRELEDTREDHVEEKITEEEEEDQGYVLLAQEDHDEEEEQDEVEMQEQRNQLEGQEQLQDEKVAAVEDESLKVMAQVEESALEDDRLVPVVALDEMTIADDSGLHRHVEEEEEVMNRADDEQDSWDVDIRVVLEEKRMLDSSVATPADVIEDSVVPISPIPRPETVTSPSDPNENFIPQDGKDTVEIGESTAEEEHIVVPQVTEEVPEDDNRDAEVDTNCEASSALEEPAAPSAAPDDQPSPLESLHDAAPTEQASEAEQEVVTDTARLDHLPNRQDEAEEDKAPETPTYGGAIQRSDRMFLLERKRSLSLSLDGSVASEMEGGEPSSVDQLNSALQAERKALGALYAELEEERNAAAIATNQTMAMINRLQEEKAAMQMEALQYQRMMEEQSEYDQEALQLLNELVTKREREKQELERELELYRQKAQHYEDKARRRMASFKANGVSPNGGGTSASSSGEDSDEHSDDYCELGESPDGGNLQSTSGAALSPMTGQDGTRHLVALDDSLTYFEMERLSILEELKMLEERLFTLEDDDINTTNAAAGHSSDDFDLSADGLRSPESGFTGDKAKFGGKTSICRGKSLLPLFDAVCDENCDQTPSATVGGEAKADDSTTKSVSVLAKEQERLAIIEEVDHVYERLEALEADKEFLRHCIKSLKKGDKGMDLLQEILQHLRDLRNVDLHVKNAGDALAANSA
ncbi:myosin-binding protein 2-like isoform X2 [Phragmites australis]|uniref:myosin-binding protein 2-like isoform X2 n=1 Tax=Phragmites australis TaxID=29695 RepID=UPI002D79E9E4|nr:myosin-binding protein 2-like isoform X2 [Phragmites australis]